MTDEEKDLFIKFLNLKPALKGVYGDTRVYYDTSNLLGYTTQHAMDHFRFNSSWDWLMPVVEKISFMLEHHETKSDMKSSLLNCNIEQTYKYVIKFIKWYNEQ